MRSAHEEDYPRQQPYRHGYQCSIRESTLLRRVACRRSLTPSLPLTRLSPSQHGGTSLSIWDPSLSRVPTSVICPDTLVVMSTLTVSCKLAVSSLLPYGDRADLPVPSLLSSTRNPESSPRSQSTSPRFPRKTEFPESPPPSGTLLVFSDVCFKWTDN
jgi:hypothetical protein